MCEKFIPHVAAALKDLVGFSDDEQKEIAAHLSDMLEKKRGTLEKIGVDNPDYDEELAAIGSEEEKPEEEEQND